jgi:hypothetical protein
MVDNLVEIVNELDHEGRYKVVQLYVDEKPVMILQGSHKFHWEILKYFLEERLLNYDTLQAPGSNTHAEVPALTGSNYRVVGMGWVFLHPSSKYYSGIEGISTDYQIGTNKEHAELFKKTLISQGWECD